MFGGFGVGVLVVYILEEGVSFDMFVVDVCYFKNVFVYDQGQSCVGCFILINEKVFKVYNVKLIVDIFCEELYGRFESCEGIFGYMQQGGVLLFMDRCWVVRLVIWCIQYLEQFGCNVYNRVKVDFMSIMVIGIKGVSVVFMFVKQVEEEEMDWFNRWLKVVYWLGMKEIVDILGGCFKYEFFELDLIGIKVKDVKCGIVLF